MSSLDEAEARSTADSNVRFQVKAWMPMMLCTCHRGADVDDIEVGATDAVHSLATGEGLVPGSIALAFALGFAFAIAILVTLTSGTCMIMICAEAPTVAMAVVLAACLYQCICSCTISCSCICRGRFRFGLRCTS